MSSESYLEIPRIFTALAEALACLVYILPLRKRHDGDERLFYLIAGPIVLGLIQLISGELPLAFWIPGMLVAMLAMFLYIRSVCDITNYDAGYLFIRAFIAAEFIASTEWQVYYYLLYKGIKHTWWLSVTVMLLVYIPFFLLVYWIDSRKASKENKLGITLKELFNTLLIGIATFSISNINFVMDNPFVVRKAGANLLYIRTLVDFSGMLLLFAQNEQRREMSLKHELEAMNNILHKHYEQYQQSKESMDIINHKYHDLKHQIALIRAEEDPVKKDVYLEEIDHAINIYKSQYDTGNTVIDTILTGKSLYCNDQGISLSCVVNGELLDFMMVMDICSIFGNALDNSIESVQKIKDVEKRIIRVAVFSKNKFLMMRFENSFEETLTFRDGLPLTTKSDSNYHGYGIKSVKTIIEKYGGHLSISAEDKWFVMKILIPMP